jgi:hypothetical protein
MCKSNYSWNNIEITWENNNIDYYVIINYPLGNEHFIPEKTIIFQMEPWVFNNNCNWGVKTWNNWSIPDESKFLKVIGRKTDDYNNVLSQLELNYNDLINLKYDIKKDELSTICSSKYFDEGHIHRIDFLKYIEDKNDIKLNIFNSDNKFNFKNYKGSLTPYINKSNGLIPFKYYFMVENNYEENFITEKIWEPIISETLCFYYGCPNITKYINKDAFVLLDMYDFEKSYQIIKQAIEEDWWSKRIDIIKKEKNRILNEMQFFPRIEKIIYNDILDNKKNICFIHSCTLNNNGTKRLKYLINYLQNSKLYNVLDKIYINNIGLNIDNIDLNIDNSKFELYNYSENSNLFEIPTLNKLLKFSKDNNNYNILYIHNKGISYDDNYEQLNDWINMMLYFVIDKYDICLNKLLSYEVVGSNYLNSPYKHFSGNFWWANSNYLQNLYEMNDINVNKMEAEMWLFKNNPTYYEMHNSNINHYHTCYPKYKYNEFIGT